MPFLVALIDNPDTPDRAALVGLLSAIALGFRHDDGLPFDPNIAFAEAAQLGEEQYQDAIGRLLREDADWSDEETST